MQLYLLIALFLLVLLVVSFCVNLYQRRRIKKNSALSDLTNSGKYFMFTQTKILLIVNTSNTEKQSTGELSAVSAEVITFNV